MVNDVLPFFIYKEKKTEIPALPKVTTNKSSITLPVIATLELD